MVRFSNKKNIFYMAQLASTAPLHTSRTMSHHQRNKNNRDAFSAWTLNVKQVQGFGSLRPVSVPSNSRSTSNTMHVIHPTCTKNFENRFTIASMRMSTRIDVEKYELMYPSRKKVGVKTRHRCWKCGKGPFAKLGNEPSNGNAGSGHFNLASTCSVTIFLASLFHPIVSPLPW